MAKLKKGSDAAKAWGKKMKALRTSKTKANINKPVFVKRSKVKPKMSKKNSRRHGKKGTTFHVIPDLFYAGAALELVGPAAGNVYDGFKQSGLGGLADNIDYSIKNQIIPAALPAAELAVAGIVIQKVAKWMGLNKIGSKDVKVF